MVEISSVTSTGELSLASAFNLNCRCMIVNEPALARGLEAALSNHDVGTSPATHPTMFSSTAVFLSREDITRLRSIIAGIEQVVAQPGYRLRALTWADQIARYEPGTRGAFMGYDFHMTEEGPKLIEINTNAGGALLNAILARAARSCCREAEEMAIGSANPEILEDTFMEMMRSEWRAQHGSQPLKTIIIVDDAPEAQYLHLEFRLFQKLFERHGLHSVIADASALSLRGQHLYIDELQIDLVYNRLTDFCLTETRHASLREAYLSGAVVLTPGPRTYALYADKRNLTLLSNHEFLESLPLPRDVIEVLASGIPSTVLVTPDRAAAFWSQRKQWFFKPTMGFGGRAAYRGDKLTKRVFDTIVRGEYVAQARVEPSKRANPQVGEGPLKYDLRCFVYNGEIQLFAARLYQGQTTNFRTPGGGFAPVFYARESAA